MTEINFVISSTGSEKMFNELSDGLRRAHRVKCRVAQSHGYRDDIVLACWGWRRGQLLRRNGNNILVFERGYLGDRFQWTSVAWNGLNGRADFCLPEEVSSDRFNQYFTMKPWKDDGKNIIIMGQVMGDASLNGKNLTKFYESVAKELKDYYRRPVYFRPHPMALKKQNAFMPDIPIIGGDLDAALSDAFLVVTFNSNSAVDAVMNGIPALCFDIGCMAYSVTGHTVKDRIFPDREKWAARLAHCQWTQDELKSGAYWPRLKKKVANNSINGIKVR